MHQIDPESETITPDDDSLYLYVNNDIKYRLFEDIVDSYHDCYSQQKDLTIDDHSNTCTHEYHHIAQSIQDLSDSTQQNNLYYIEENALLFADNTVTSCDFSIIDQHSVMKMQMISTHLACQNNLASTHNENMHTETLLVNQTYSIMILTIKIHSHSQINTKHCYNKNYKIDIGIYMTQ